MESREPTAPPVVQSTERLSRTIAAWRDAGDRIAVVPTMGALHEGHLSLVRAAREEADRVVVTIFVNPSQFAPTEDLARYPRTLSQDLELLRPCGVDLVFVPDEAAIYPPGFATWIEPPPMARRWEGEVRPTHFRGVLTVVLKLLHLTRADLAWFGQKDFQQLCLIRQMVRDLNLPCEIRMGATCRDEDGLALSSRNRYLDPGQRESALALIRSLRAAASWIAEGERDGHVVMTGLNQSLIDGGVTEIDYAVVADVNTLETMHAIRFPAVLLVAARVGATRLIDNLLVE